MYARLFLLWSGLLLPGPEGPGQRKIQDQKVIAVVSGKGGVGKSTVTASLATAMAKRGRKVAVLDADITGPSIPTAFGIHERAMATEDGIQPAVTSGGIKLMSLNLLTENETDPVIWRGPVILKRGHPVLDRCGVGRCGLYVRGYASRNGETALTVFQSLPVDGIVVVTSPGSGVHDRHQGGPHGADDVHPRVGPH